jgi:hypothetical protein
MTLFLSEAEALTYMQGLLGWSIVIQTVELISINLSYKGDNIWSLGNANSNPGAGITTWSLGFLLNRNGFTLVLLMRLLAAITLLVSPLPILPLLLLVLSYFTAIKYRGPFNGGSDYMTFQALTALCLYNYADNHQWQLIALWYLTIQVVLSYFIAGWVKLKRPEWRSGLALCRFILNSNYRVPERLKVIFVSQQFCFISSWVIILFELLFPVILIWPQTTPYFITMAFMFHLLVFYIFGLNRFVWAWAATYPALIFCCRSTLP